MACRVGLVQHAKVCRERAPRDHAELLQLPEYSIPRMRDIYAVVVDNTGALTLSHPALTHFLAEGIPENEALVLVAGVEQLSERSIGLAIVEGAKAHGLIPRTAGAFDAINGPGVQADIVASACS